MKILDPARIIIYTRCALVAAAGLVFAGCSSSNSSTAVPTATTPRAEGKAGGKVVATAEGNVETPKSVFKIDQNSRDPFFPSARRAVAVVEAARQTAAPVDVIGLLRQGFQGVIGSGETRIGLINNVMLEPGRQTVIPISAAGQSRSIPVRCRDVTRDTVVLEVQGYPEPVRIARLADK